MRKLLLLLTLITCSAYSTNYTATTQAEFEAFYSVATGGDTIFVSGTVAITSTITMNRDGSSGNPIVISGGKLLAFKSLTSWTNEGGNIWKCADASTLDSINIVMVNGVNTEVGRYPNAGEFFYWVSHNLAGATYSDTIIVSGLDNTYNLTGAKIFSRLSFAPPISYVKYHNLDTIVRTRDTYSNSVENYAMVFFTNHLSTLDVQNE